jgi:glutathione S-transferase
MYEIHGKGECPFAWRVRLTAREKGLPFEWIRFDAPSPDARATHHNPDRRSPLLWDDGFVLEESLVIAEYLEESGGGRALLPVDPKERARARLLLATLVPGLEASPAHVKDRNAEVEKARQGQAALDRALADGRHWLGGGAPALPDLMIWPFLALQQQGGAAIPPELARARSYWNRVREHPSFVATRP